MKTSLIIVLAIAASAGCNKSPEYLSSYQVIIDPSFTTDEMNDMSAAAAVWQATVPIVFQVSIGDCLDPQKTQICVRKTLNSGSQIVDGQSEEINADTYMDGDRDIIYMFPRASSGDEEFFEQVFLHELGHAQGLEHHEGCNVMNPINNECSKTPSKDDIAQWYSVPREE